MSDSKATRSIIDTHRHIFGPKLKQKFVENIGFDDTKPLPQANAGEMFFYRESVDVDYAMEIQQKSEAAMYASKHGKFWEMHYLLFENQERLSDSLLLELADQLGLSSSDLSVALEKNTYRPRVRTDFDSGIRSGVNGTPTLFINDERYDGLLGFDSVVDRIAHVLAASKV